MRNLDQGFLLVSDQEVESSIRDHLVHVILAEAMLGALAEKKLKYI